MNCLGYSTAGLSSQPDYFPFWTRATDFRSYLDDRGLDEYSVSVLGRWVSTFRLFDSFFESLKGFWNVFSAN